METEETKLRYKAVASSIPVPCYGCNRLSYDAYKVYFPTEETGELQARVFCPVCFEKIKESFNV